MSDRRVAAPGPKRLVLPMISSNFASIAFAASSMSALLAWAGLTVAGPAYHRGEPLAPAEGS